jgi:hypothetical protein
VRLTAKTLVWNLYAGSLRVCRLSLVYLASRRYRYIISRTSIGSRWKLSTGAFGGTAVLTAPLRFDIVMQAKSIDVVAKRVGDWLCEVVSVELVVVRRYDVMVMVDAENPE